MEHNAYSLISFQRELYAENATRTIVPEPNSLLRVFMAWQALEESVVAEPKTQLSFRREGLAVMEGMAQRFGKRSRKRAERKVFPSGLCLCGFSRQ